jgi:hypothetical protein
MEPAESSLKPPVWYWETYHHGTKTQHLTFDPPATNHLIVFNLTPLYPKDPADALSSRSPQQHLR